MKNAIHLLLKYLKIFCLLLALVLCGITLVNFKDEPPNSEVITLRHPTPNPYRDDQNLYLAWMGAYAPENVSPTEWGSKIIADYESKLDAALKNLCEPSRASIKEDFFALSLKGQTRFYQPQLPSSWQNVQAAGHEIDQAINENRVLFQRYLDRHRLSGYYETATPSHLQPWILYSTQSHGLFLSYFASKMQSKELPRQKNALSLLKSDSEAWRTMLTGEGALLSKIIAIHRLQANFLALSDAIANSGNVFESMLPEFEDALSLYPLKDWTLHGALPREFNMSNLLLRHAEFSDFFSGFYLDENNLDTCSIRSKPWVRLLNQVGHHFYKVQATENRHAEIVLQQMNTLRCAPSELKKCASDFQKQEDYQTTSPTSWLYNPIGKLVLLYLSPSSELYTSYALRAYDTAALQRLVKLSFEIRKQHIPSENVSEFIEQHSEWATHPSDQRPFVWDSEAQTLSFTPQAKHPSNTRFKIFLKPINASPPT